MIIKIEKRESPYVQIDVRFLSDNRLTAKAKGILAYLLSKPTNWEVRIKDLENRFADGATAIRSGLKELRTYGYAELVRLRNENGKMLGSSYIIRELPKDIDNSTEIAVLRVSEKTKIGKNENRETYTHSNNDFSSNIELLENNEKEYNFAVSNETATNTHTLANSLKEALDLQETNEPIKTEVKTKKEKTAHPCYAGFIDLFVNRYKELFESTYTGINGRQGKEMNEIIKKCTIKLKDTFGAGYEPTCADLTNYFNNLLQTNTHKFFLENFTISTLNTQFDLIVNSMPKIPKNLDTTASKLKDFIYALFSITNENNATTTLVNDFLAYMQEKPNFDLFKRQYWAYHQYILGNNTGFLGIGIKFRKNIKDYFGSKAQNYEDGFWNSQNWIEILKAEIENKKNNLKP